MKILFFLFLLSTLLFSVTNKVFEKQLSSKNRAETYLENLVFDGEFEEAEKFLTLANKKFPSNANLLCWSGKLYIEKKSLDEAKNYFLKALAIDPTHEIAKLQLELIKEQENIQENENIEKLLEFIEDKGLDFLMIFLAFLGGEIIAKRYNICKNSSIYLVANQYAKKQLAQKDIKFQVLLDSYKEQKFFSFCFFINLLVILTIALALMVILLFVVFYFELNVLFYGDFLTITAQEIEYNFMVLFIVTLLFTILFRAFMRYKELSNDTFLYEIILVEELDRLVETGEYVTLYKIMKYLKAHHVNDENISKLLYKYSQNAEYILSFNINKS